MRLAEKIEEVIQDAFVKISRDSFKVSVLVGDASIVVLDAHFPARSSEWTWFTWSPQHAFDQ